jgi:hypothetical protein
MNKHETTQTGPIVTLKTEEYGQLYLLLRRNPMPWNHDLRLRMQAAYRACNIDIPSERSDFHGFVKSHDPRRVGTCVRCGRSRTDPMHN